jgi:hypothetical protein
MSTAFEREIDLSAPAPLPSGLSGRDLVDAQFARLPPPASRASRRRRTTLPPTSYNTAGLIQKPARFARPKLSDSDFKGLYDIVIPSKSGIGYNPRFTTKEGALGYITKHNLEEKWNVTSGDYDDDVETPDNVIVWDSQNRPHIIDGYYLTPRRTDVLNYPRIQKVNEDFASGVIKTKEEADAIKSSIKKYYKTHTTPVSQAAETPEQYAARAKQDKVNKVLHKMYLEKFPKEERNEQNEFAYKNGIYQRYGDGIATGPVMILRSEVANRVRDVKVRDKLKLLNGLYRSAVLAYKTAKGIDADDKLIGENYLTIAEKVASGGMDDRFKLMINTIGQSL